MIKPWWQTDEYIHDNALPQDFTDHAGPNGVALVRAWPDGRTDKGWGLMGPDGSEGFIPRYERGEFNQRRVLYGFEKGKWAFAIIMRSVRLVCIDIDGKNGGLEHAKRLGMLPHTMSETSKSGDGYHLFYSVDEQWDDARGFGLLGDRIGIEQGVDVRAVGCVYHHPQQRWNDRPVAPLPEHLKTLLLHREQKVAAQTERIVKVLQSSDETEILMMHDEILTDLAKPIPAGKRNTTLFAIGSQMQSAQIHDWDEKLYTRALDVGLDNHEAQKIVENVKRYAAAQP